MDVSTIPPIHVCNVPYLITCIYSFLCIQFTGNTGRIPLFPCGYLEYMIMQGVSTSPCIQCTEYAKYFLLSMYPVYEGGGGGAILRVFFSFQDMVGDSFQCIQCT